MRREGALFARLTAWLADRIINIAPLVLPEYGRSGGGNAKEREMQMDGSNGFEADCLRVAQTVEPYPNRWTHQVIRSSAEELDHERMGWITESFAQSKR